MEKLYSFAEKILFKAYPRIYRRLYSWYKAVSDSGERRLCRSVISPGDVVVDVGANIGIYSEFFLQLIGPDGELHAFEPESTNFKFLAHSLKPYKNVFVYNKAVADCTNQIILYLSKDLNVDHQSFDTGEGREKVIVSCISLDELFGAEKQIDFVKIDIQGFEYQALQGMAELLAFNPKIKLLLEYIPSGLEAAGHSGAELIELLRGQGFSLYSIARKGSIQPLNGAEPSLNSMGYTNIFAAREN